MDKMVQKPNYVEELLEILRGSLAADELQDQIIMRVTLRMHLSS